MLLSEATDPTMNPYLVDGKGKFVAEPVVDFAQEAINKAREARKKAVGDDDWPLLWRVRPEYRDD